MFMRICQCLLFSQLVVVRPVLGTFHSKFMIVDRAVALVCSNNIQDRCNMEMMVHLEGPVVDGLYDQIFGRPADAED